MKIYRLTCDNKYQVPLIKNLKENGRYLEGKEWRPLKDGWHSLPFYFYADPKDIKKGWDKRPDICKYHEGLFVPRDLLDVVFSAEAA